MSPVNFKKWPCRPVEFRGQGPLLREVSGVGSLGALDGGGGGGGSPCCMSNLRNGNVAFHYRFPLSCRVARAPCRMSNLRNGHIAVSNLVVQTHSI